MPKSLAPPPTAGFTLIEMLVVIFIIGLVLSLTLPHLQNPSRDAQLFAVQFAAIMNDASNIARTQEEQVVVTYTSTNTTYGLSVFDPSTGSSTPIPGSTTLRLPPNVLLPAQYMRQTGPVLFFDELGRNMQVQGFGFTSVIQVFHKGELVPDASVVMERLAARSTD